MKEVLWLFRNLRCVIQYGRQSLFWLILKSRVNVPFSHLAVDFIYKTLQLSWVQETTSVQGLLFWEARVAINIAWVIFWVKTMMQSWALFDFCLWTLQMPFPTPVGRKWSCLVKPYEEEKFFIYLNVKTKIKGAQKVHDCGIPLDFFF